MTAQQVEAKRQDEIQVVGDMIRLYCSNQHNGIRKNGDLCPACHTLYAYATERLRRCPRMAEKTFCSECPIHCYAPSQREQIRQIMRYAGPRMLWHRPLMTLRHMYLCWHVSLLRKKKS